MEHSLLDVVWKMSWQVAILAALVWIVCRLASKAPAAWRHALWIVVLVKFFMPPVVHFPSQLAFWQTAGRAKPQPAIRPQRRSSISRFRKGRPRRWRPAISS